MVLRTLSITGADLDGTDGTASRTYTLPYASATSTGMQIFINGVYQHYGASYDYTLADNVLTFNNVIWNTQIISGKYTTGTASDEDVDYCLIQDVYDNLDGKTSSDVSEAIVVSAIQYAEGLIDTRTGTSFIATTESDEVHTADRYSLDVSPDYLDSVSMNINTRRDNLRGVITNRIRTKYKPIISVTHLYTNSAGADQTDSWTELTEQTGSGGDFVIEDKNTGTIDILDNYPRIGKRSWKITYVYGYDQESSDRRVLMILRVVERLTILLACKHIITQKASGTTFDSVSDVRIGSIEVKGGSVGASVYLATIEKEIKELWGELGSMGIEVI